jgi:hypothetical protein
LRTPTNRRWRSTPGIPRDKPLCEGLRMAARAAKTRETGRHGLVLRHGRHRVECSPIIRTAGEPHRMFSGCSQRMWVHSQIMWVWVGSYSHGAWARKCDVLGQDDLCYRAVTGSVPITRYRGRRARSRDLYHASLMIHTLRRHGDALGDVPLSQQAL